MLHRKQTGTVNDRRILNQRKKVTHKQRCVCISISYGLRSLVLREFIVKNINKILVKSKSISKTNPKNNEAWYLVPHIQDFLSRNSLISSLK